MGCHQKYLEKCANLKTETVIISTYPQYSFNGNGSIVQKSLRKKTAMVQLYKTIENKQWHLTKIIENQQ